MKWGLVMFRGWIGGSWRLKSCWGRGGERRCRMKLGIWREGLWLCGICAIMYVVLIGEVLFLFSMMKCMLVGWGNRV